jgi:hypothetical protein
MSVALFLPRKELEGRMRNVVISQTDPERRLDKSGSAENQADQKSI